MGAGDPASSAGTDTVREPIDVLALIGGDLTVVRWTGAAERMWGYSAAEVVNRPAQHLLAPPGESVTTDLLTASRPWSGLVGIRRSDGREAEVEMRVTPLRGDAGEEDWFVWSGEPVVWPAMKPSVLNALFERSPIGIAIWDPDLRCSWFNSGDTNEGVFRSGAELGRHLSELVATDHPAFLETAMRHVLEDGVPLLDHELGPHTAARPDTPCISVSFFRLDDTQGRVVGVCSMAMNVRDSRARQRLNMLSAAGTRIGTTLDPMYTAQELADTAVPALADYVTVDLAEVLQSGKEPLEHLDSTDVSIPVFYRAGAASVHADLRESLWHRGAPVFVPPSSPFTAVLGSRRSHFEPILDASPGTWLDNDPDRARIIDATGMHSLMIVPLQARGTMLGVAVFVRTENRAPFTHADLAIAEGLCDRAALSLDSALRYTRERETALALQHDLLPHRLWGGGSVEVASRYLPSDTHGGVGGDWFDVIPLPDARVVLVVGDVVGHGINAAAAMGRLRTVVHTLTNLRIPPGRTARPVGRTRHRDGPGASRRHRIHLDRRGSHLSLCDLRPRYPALRHGERGASPARDHLPRRHRRVRRCTTRAADRSRNDGVRVGRNGAGGRERDRAVHRRPDRDARKGHRRRAGPAAWSSRRTGTGSGRALRGSCGSHGGHSAVRGRCHASPCSPACHEAGRRPLSSRSRVAGPRAYGERITSS